MPWPRKSQLALLVAACSCLAATTVGSLACGYHGSLGNGFSAQHPRSIDVALASREAIDKGMIEGLKALPPMLALARVGRALDELRRDLADADAEEPPAPSSLALLLIDAGLWTRYRFAEDRLVYEPHAAGPDQTDAVILTSEAALQALLNGRLSLDDAVSTSLLVVAPDSLSLGTLKILRKWLHPRLRSSNKN
jgi:hypothetical protein